MAAVRASQAGARAAPQQCSTAKRLPPAWCHPSATSDAPPREQQAIAHDADAANSDVDTDFDGIEPEAPPPVASRLR
jgi:hypothetical protein